LEPFIDLFSKKKVPVHKHSIWYYTGGIALFLFLVQVTTGLLLVMYYQPGESTSYESVRFIMNNVHFGWLIRSIHSWSANLMVFFVFVHMFSTLFTGAFRKPRELTWITGTLLLFLVMAFGFSGYLLPWNELAYFATKVGTEIAGALPLIGHWLLLLLRGGEDITSATIARFYAFHVSVLPLFLIIILAVHLFLIQIQGMSEPDEFRLLPEREKKYIPFFPNFVLRDLIVWLLFFNILIILAVYSPWELGLKADPFKPAPPGIKPEWYFLFMFQTLKLFPGHILFLEGEKVAIIGLTIASVVWLFLPFWPIKVSEEKKLKIYQFIGLVALFYIIVMSIWAILT